MANRSSTITLYSRTACVHSHRVRLVMAEKGVASYDIVELRKDEVSEDLLELNPAEYKAAVADLTNFLVYVGEPAKLVRYALGFKVIVFLLLFTALAYLLKREFWRDVH